MLNGVITAALTVSGHCSTRVKRGQRCTVTVTLFTRKIAAKAGATKTSVTLPHLAPGRYRLTVQATNRAGRSRTLRFVIQVTR